MIHHEYFIRGQDKVIKLHPTHCPYNYFLINNLKRVGEKLCVEFFLNCSVIFIDDVFKSQYASECIDWKSNKASRTCMVYVLFNAHGFITHQSTMKFNHFSKILNLTSFETTTSSNIMYTDRHIKVGNSFQQQTQYAFWNLGFSICI